MLQTITDRVNAFFSYSKTILAARLYTFVGALFALQGSILPWLSGQDWTPVYQYVFKDVHPAFQALVIGAAVAATGELFVWLRKKTDVPLAEKVEDGTAARLEEQH